VACHEIVNDVFIVSGSLVWRRHPSVDYGKLSLLDEVSHAILFLFVLTLPPHHQELHLSICEGSLRVFFELLYHGRKHAIN